jgi:putative phosphonate metabolism protein
MNCTGTETRFAIYYVPDPNSELYRFGASVLGYDCYGTGAVEFPSEAGADWAGKVVVPRKYGFHATLKAPFRLAAGESLAALTADLDTFARAHPAVDVGPLRVAEIGSFIALVPAAPCRPLDDLAAACVERFDRFRAPLTAEDLARRLSAPLTERQRAQLERWGYPYVFDDFRFHLTLTDPLADAERAPALRSLQTAFAVRPAAQRLLVDRVVIARQVGDGEFQVVESALLTGGSTSHK